MVDVQYEVFGIFHKYVCTYINVFVTHDCEMGLIFNGRKYTNIQVQRISNRKTT